MEKKHFLLKFFSISILITGVYFTNISFGASAFDDEANMKVLEAWRAEGAFITHFGTSLNEVNEGPIGEKPGSIDGRKLKEFEVQELYCAFPIPRFIKDKKLRKIALTLTPTKDVNNNEIIGGGDSLLNAYVKILNNEKGRGGGYFDVQGKWHPSPGYYMELERIGLPDDSLIPRAKTNKIYVKLYDRGPEFGESLDCSPATLRSLGLHTSTEDSRAKGKPSQVKARLVKRTTLMDVLFNRQYTDGVVIVPKSLKEI